jgi:replicative DNA helicase
MKDIAKEFGVLIVALVQLSRQAGSGRKAVALDMARDSGVIEEAADLIIGVHRPLELAEEETLQDVPMIADVLKNRHGRTGRVEWNFNKWSLRIEPKPFPEK